MTTPRQTSGVAKSKRAVSPTMLISDILESVADAAEIFALHGLHCAGCQFSSTDTLEEGAALHGMSEEKLQELIKDLETGLPESLRRPKTITLTKSAAEALRDTLKEQGKEQWKLVVTTDEQGGFCMEFAEKAPENCLVFRHKDVPEVDVVAAEITLASIGGSTINMREGRFKLDLPSASECACKEGT